MDEEKARQIQRRHAPRLASLPGVQAVGLGKDADGNQQLVVVADPTVDADALPPELEGLPVVLERSEPFKPLDKTE
jgi:hypothetical protein